MALIDQLHAALQRKSRALQRLYDVFSSYRLSEYGASEGACPHCVGEEEFQAVQSAPISRLSQQQIWAYCSAVWPGIADFKYFLPRLLEVTDPGAEVSDWEELSRKLPAAGWTVCSEVELAAVAHYLVARDDPRAPGIGFR